jgi:dTMP kinase
VYTAYARDIVRSSSPTWVRKVYDFAIKPDATFYFRVPNDIAIERISVGRPKLKYYEAGMDLDLSNDPTIAIGFFKER